MRASIRTCVILFMFCSWSCGAAQRRDEGVRPPFTCASATDCGEDEQCLEGHCLPETCDDIRDCPYGFGCRNSQCEAAECHDADPNVEGSQGNPCPEEYHCVYADEVTREHGDGLCDEAE